MLYLRITTRYTIENAKHLMRMMVTGMFYLTTNAANARTKRNTFSINQLDQEASLSQYAEGDVEWTSSTRESEKTAAESEHHLMLQDAPASVRRLIYQVDKDGGKIGRETNYQFIHRVLGVEVEKC